MIVLRLPGEVVPATLADSPAAHEFAALLPLTLDVDDRWGQGKIGRLRLPIDTDDAQLMSDPAAGGIYYAPASGSLAVFYDDLGQTVPDGLVHLGTVDGDLVALASSGHRIRLGIYPADQTTN